MIELERDGGLWTVRINRPDKANSLTQVMLEELADIAGQAMEAEDLRAFVLTGTGDKVFSAGADLDEAKAGLATSAVWEVVSGRIAALPCLSIAALNGTLAGGAFGMALACDLRLCPPHARFFYPVAKLGFLPQPSDPGRLVALMGPARAKLLLVGAQRFSADEAYQFGLVDRIVSEGSVLEAAREVATDALTGNRDVIQDIKAMCNA